jgi:hypothetical protein
VRRLVSAPRWLASAQAATVTHLELAMLCGFCRTLWSWGIMTPPVNSGYPHRRCLLCSRALSIVPLDVTSNVKFKDKIKNFKMETREQQSQTTYKARM